MQVNSKAGSFGCFLAAYAKHWFSAVSGGLSVPGAILALFVTRWWQKALWGVLAIGGALSASYSVWLQQRREADQSLSARSVTDQVEIYKVGARLACMAAHSIKILVYATKPPAPDWFAQMVASHLASHRAVVLDVVIAVDLSSVSAKFWDAQAERYGIYRNLEVQGQVRRFMFDTKKPIGFDLIIVDDIHVAVGFSPVAEPGQRNKEFALHFEGQPRVAAQFRAWFDNTLLISKAATPFDEAYSQWSLKATSQKNA